MPTPEMLRKMEALQRTVGGIPIELGQVYEDPLSNFTKAFALLKQKEVTTSLAQFISLHSDAKIPTSAYATDSGYDLYAVEGKMIYAGGSAVVDVGLQVADIKEGYWFKIEARSGLGFKKGIQPHPGIIDQSFRGPLSVKLYNFSQETYAVNPGDRIAQIVFYPLVKGELLWTTEVKQTDRGSNKFGSSGI